jgi:hypothetical protein
MDVKYMFGMWDLVLMCIGLGVLIGVGIALLGIFINRRQYPHLYVNFTERQNGLVCEILKARLVNKKGSKDWFVKKPVLCNGLGAMFAPETLINDPDPALAITNTSGGVIMVTRTASPNVLLPCSVEIIKDQPKLDLIIKYINIGNWYKGKVKFNAKSEILHPKTFLGANPEVKIIAAGIIFVMIMVIYTAMVHPILVQLMSEQSAAVTGFTQAIRDLTASVSSTGATLVQGQ